MKVITVRSKIRGVAAAWKKQYSRGSWSTDSGKQAIGEKLAALDVETATADDVMAIIGNDSWTRLGCDQCEEQSDPVVRLGQESGYESATVYACVPCLRKAIAAAKRGAAK